MTFAKWLRQMIEWKGISQRGLATAAGVSLGRIAAYMKGPDEPTLSNARRICRALGVSLATLDKELDAPNGDRPAATRARGKK